MGVPVIATNWSGHTLFVNDTTAWPVPLAGLACIDNVDAAGLYARHRWAEPSVAALRSIMRRHVEGGGLQDAEVAARAAAAQRLVRRRFSQEAVAQTMRRVLPQWPAAEEPATGGQGDDTTQGDEEGLADDEGLLLNLYDAAMGRVPSWNERRWAARVGWRERCECSNRRLGLRLLPALTAERCCDL